VRIISPTSVANDTKVGKSNFEHNQLAAGLVDFNHFAAFIQHSPNSVGFHSGCADKFVSHIFLLSK
jgi:hypothetical protein